MKDIFKEIKIERENQEKKWGQQNHPCLDQTLLNRKGGCEPQRMTDEYEIPTESRAKFLCDNSADKGQLTFAHILSEEFSEVVSEFDIHKRREELVQLVAVGVAWIEKIDRDLLKGTENER